MTTEHTQLFTKNAPTTYVGFIVQDLKLALPSDRISFIVMNSIITPIPKTGNKHVVGVCGVTTNPVPVIDIESFFMLSSRQDMFNSDAKRYIICVSLKAREVEVAFVADAVVGAINVTGRQLHSSSHLPRHVFHKLSRVLDGTFTYTDSGGVESTFFLLSVPKFFTEITS